MKRVSELTPAYDCITRPCGKNGCGTAPGASHGTHCDVWRYSVVDDDGRFAVTLVVDAGNWPNAIPREPEASTLATHEHPSLVEEDEATEPDLAAWDRMPCTLIDGGQCVSDCSFAYAERFFGAYGAPTYVQPERFWRALESDLRIRRGR